MALNPLTIAKAATTIGKLGTSEDGRMILFAGILTPLILVLLVVSSPMAIFFANVDNGSDDVPILEVIVDLQEEFRQEIVTEQSDPRMDTVRTIVTGSEDNTVIDNSVDVLSFFSTLNTLKKGEQVAYIDNSSKNKLENIFWEMNIIEVDIETRTKTDTTYNIDGSVAYVDIVTTYHKTITINSLSADEMADMYRFNDEEKTVLDEVMLSSALILPTNTKMYLTSIEVESIKEKLPENLSIERTAIVENALSLVGKVNYFWGGKSHAIGFDSRWGTMMEVTSEGSSSTGKMKSFGLDCSGYITWVFIQLGLDTSTIEETIGHGTTAQWNLSTSIDKSLVKEGDLAFLAVPNTQKSNHIGIVVSIEDDGSIIVAHCNSRYNNVSLDTAENVGLKYFRRPAILITNN